MRTPGSHPRKLETLTTLARMGALAALIAVASRQPALAADPPACRPVRDAEAKQLTTPHHFYSTMASPADNLLGDEGIVVGGVLYDGLDGRWTRSPVSLADLQKERAEDRKRSKVLSCRYLRDETVRGEAAAVYSEHSESDAGTSDATTWISKRRGLLLKRESDVELVGITGKSHQSIRYEYGNVKAPAGAK
jgi:hypothetical protein